MNLIKPLEGHFSVMHLWSLTEPRPDLHTCRPVRLEQDFRMFKYRQLSALGENPLALRVMVKADDPEMPIGQIRSFDYNPRNRSIEFGMYLPPSNRLNGVGGQMASMFLDELFSERSLDLNKVYATTSANNIGMINILERLGFNRDGVNRAHFEVDGNLLDQWVYSILRSEWTTARIL